MSCVAAPGPGEEMEWFSQSLLFSVSIIVSRLKFAFLKDRNCKQAPTNTDNLKKIVICLLTEVKTSVSL